MMGLHRPKGVARETPNQIAAGQNDRAAICSLARRCQLMLLRRKPKNAISSDDGRGHLR